MRSSKNHHQGKKNMMQPIIQLTNISAAYGNKTVLHNVDLVVCDHDFLGMIGPNGGGKTTLIQMILGLKKPSEGTIKFFRNGEPVDKITMGYLPQYNDIDKEFPISVEDVVLSGLSSQKKLFNAFTAKQHEMVDKTLERMQLSDFHKRHIGSLSGGQLQRVLLARAIVSQPEVLVLDEPNTYIDQYFQEQVYQMLSDINHDCAIIMVSHDIGGILQNVKSIACVNKTLHYHPDTELPMEELEEQFGCPIDLIGHGNFPHRLLKQHKD